MLTAEKEVEIMWNRWLVKDLVGGTLNALPLMIASGLIYWFVRRFIHKKKFGSEFKEVRRKSRLNEIIGLLLVMWAGLIIGGTMLVRWNKPVRMGIIPQWHLIPELIRFGHIDDMLHFLLNVLMFAPIGLALPFVLKRPVFGRTVLVGFCFTFAIEFLQGFSLSRDGSIDDVIGNTLGVVVGYLLYLLMKLLFPKLTAKCMVKAGNQI